MPWSGDAGIRHTVMLRNQRAYRAVLIAVAVLAVMTRSAGLWRGTEGGREYSIHPDEAKQIKALERYLKGNYAWIVGDLFYDGYPYGLNHVDEWLIRAAAPAIQGVHRAVVGFDGQPAVHILDHPVLLRTARLLRLFYSLLAIWILADILRRWGLSRAVRAWALFLLAVAPLPVSAMHAATGDTGVDLFAVLSLWALARHARSGHWGAWLGAAFATGCAFACKYQGVLAGIAPALFLFVAAVPGSLRHVPGRAALAVLGFLGGATLLTPAVLIMPRITVRNIWLNFEFIRNYHTSSAFRELSGLHQMLYSISKNFIPVVSGLGWSVVALALVAWGASSIQAWRERAQTDPGGKRRRALRVALTGMPILALMASLLGKPEIQLFHYSWIQAPLIAAAALGLGGLARRARWLAVMAGLIAGVELGSMAVREHFFWVRAGHGEVVNLAHKIMCKDEYLRAIPRSSAASVFLEESRVAPFRNREKAITLPEGRFWSRVRGSPLPSRPAPLQSPWLFARAPALPRNLRSWIIPRNRWSQRHLVLEENPTSIRVGLRAGALPAQVTLQTGSAETRVTLRPYQPAIVELPVRAWASRSARATGRTAWLARLRTRSASGSVVAEYLPDETAMGDFLLWSGKADPRVRPAETADRLDELGMRSFRLRHWESPPGAVVWVSGRSTRATTLSPDPLWIPAGAYVIRLNARATAPGVRARVRLADTHPGPSAEWVSEIDIPAGAADPIPISFSKPLAPYDAHIQIMSLGGDLEVWGWSIESDVETMRRDLRQWASGGAPPSWCPAPLDRPEPEPPPIAAWPAGVELLRCAMDRAVSRKGILRGRLDVRLSGPPGWGEGKRFIFIHGLDESGRMRLVFDLPLIRALGGRDFEWSPAEWNSDHAPPGEYRLYLGMYDPEARKRDRLVSSSDLLDGENRMFIGRLEIVE